MRTDHSDLSEMTPQSAALFKKGEEIFEITRQIADLIPMDPAEKEAESEHDLEQEALQNHAPWMLEEAAALFIKVGGRGRRNL